MYADQRNTDIDPGGYIDEMEKECIVTSEINDGVFADFFAAERGRGIFLVADEIYEKLPVKDKIDRMARESAVGVVAFHDFAPNPDWLSVVSGVEHFRKSGCSAILAVGGGSAMDVAKCIKLYADSKTMDRPQPQPAEVPPIPFAAIPATAGTGSEATKYAVVYFQGVKQSITDERIIPELVLHDAENLLTLPLYQKKATMLDALCHGVESIWSVHSTPESMEYAQTAITELLRHREGYLSNDPDSCAGMLQAAYLAGKAINITQTTAGHAMSYRLSSLCHIAHGHAAALCVSVLWPYMLSHLEDCIDVRGREYLEDRFAQLANLFSETDPVRGSNRFQALVREMGLWSIVCPEEDILEQLVQSVNPERLKNNPVRLDENAIRVLYREILGGKA